MVKISIILMILNLLSFCSSQSCESKVLLNGTTKVPINLDACFENKKFTTLKKPVNIDTHSIYEEIGDIHNRYSVIRFYPNGRLNYYSFSFGTVYTANLFDSKINGIRGKLVYNVKNNNNYIQYYTIINHSGYIGIKTKKIIVNDDELELIDEQGHSNIFKKKIIPKELLSDDIDW